MKVSTCDGSWIRESSGNGADACSGRSIALLLTHFSGSIGCNERVELILVLSGTASVNPRRCRRIQLCTDGRANNHLG
jgi:hypothetical protein